jgi:hypothetical protein
MEFLSNLNVIVGSVAAILYIFAGIIGVVLWIRARRRLKPPEGKTEKAVEYEYCTISCYKERGALHGYFFAKTDDNHAWPYLEAYDVTRNLIPTVKPSRRVKQHVEALQRLMQRLESDGWVYFGDPDPNIWYGHRYRRIVSMTSIDSAG